jgi:hypothetical protein
VGKSDRNARHTRQDKEVEVVQRGGLEPNEDSVRFGHRRRPLPEREPIEATVL